MTSDTRTVAYAGLGISLLGAALDFDSGYSLGSMISDGTMGNSPPTSTIVLYLLGIGVLATGVLIVLPRMAGAMARLGLVMEVFGVIMVLAGAWVAGMNGLLSYAMPVVGGAMILNGVFMQRGRASMGQD